MIALIVLFVTGFSICTAVYAISSLEEKNEDALTLLQERYSKGDISAGEYVEMRQILNFHSRRG